MGVSKPNGGKPKMPDSEAKKRWIKENTTVLRIKLNHNTDDDILRYLETVDSMAGVVKKAIREYIKNHSV